MSDRPFSAYFYLFLMLRLETEYGSGRLRYGLRPVREDNLVSDDLDNFQLFLPIVQSGLLSHYTHRFRQLLDLASHPLVLSDV